MKTINRRKFIKRSLATGAIIASGSGLIWLTSGDGTQNFSIEKTIQDLNKLTKPNLTSNGRWNPSQIFNHLAQSIEYSMTGYPQHKSNIFKNTLGTVAFSAFSTRGEMSHNLAEVIPGAPVNNPNDNIHITLTRLIQALVDFDQYNGQLKPHFAYGQLSKQDYTYAHIMHVNNHLVEILTQTL